MNILLLGDFSACQLTLGRALRRMGHRVTVASEGCRWLNTPGNYDVSRHFPGLLGGALLYGRLRWLKPLRGYDVVSLISPSFVQLRPGRLRRIFDDLRRHNGGVFLHAAGTDKAFMDYYLSPDCKLEYTEFKLPGGSPNPRTRGDLLSNSLWQQGEIADFCEYLYDRIDGVTTALYEYHLCMQARLSPDKVAYTGLPVEMPASQPLRNDFSAHRPMRLLLGRDRFRKSWKGTDLLEIAARRAVDASNGRAVLDIVENLPYSEYLRRLEQADVLIDQLYSYTPALNALLAMARGCAAVSGGEEDFYRFIGEPALRPVFNVRPGSEEELQATFSRIIDSPEAVVKAAAEGVEFVRKHNDAELVAQRFLDFWCSRL